MKHLQATVFAFGALLALSACKDDDEKKKSDVAAEPSKDTKANQASSSGDSKARPAQTDYEVATEEDFEDAIQQQITAETDLSKELDRLEREIAGQ